jgi:hypothetical protein
MKISMLKSISFKVAQFALIVGCLTLGYSTKASAEVNMKLLNSVVKSCQYNPPKDNSLFGVDKDVRVCVQARYRYTLFMSKYNGLKNLGDLRPGFPNSLAIYRLASNSLSPQEFLDCMVSKDVDSSECSIVPKILAIYYGSFLGLVCSSCFEAYLSAGSNWPQSMTKDLINWFYELDKPSRKLVADSLSNSEFMELSNNEAEEARQLYSKIKEKVDRETQEQKRRDLLN